MWIVSKSFTQVVLVKEVRRMLLLVGCVGGSAVGYYFKVWLVTYLATLAGYVSYRDAALVSTATVSRLTLCLHEELLPLSSFLHASTVLAY